MSPILKEKQIVRTETSNMDCEVECLLGEGGQGEVYRSTVGGMQVALKWYLPHFATNEQRLVLETLIKKGPPNKNFLWPIELVSSQHIEGFGYIMPLRPDKYKNLIDLMRSRIEPSFRALATAGLYLSDSYLQLHSKGWCYRDISFGNVFFNPADGDILICDNDNVSVDGASTSIKGTPYFMAPEVVRDEAIPSIKTDLYSLSVLLFYMFMVHHPLSGKKEADIICLDDNAMAKLYGTEPIFIFDPDDKSNEPVKGYQDNPLTYWPVYPQFLRNLFIRAFTEGLKDPVNGRVRESEWRSAMVRLRDSLIYCTYCNSENFYDADQLKVSGGTPYCWSCSRAITLPFRMRIGRNVIMLNYDTKLFSHHIDNQQTYDFSNPIAEVNRHPTNPGIWGLKNLSTEKWVVTKGDGSIQDVEVGRSVTLATGNVIQFGRVQGEIRY